jgi:O-antigen ligase
MRRGIALKALLILGTVLVLAGAIYATLSSTAPLSILDLLRARTAGRDSGVLEDFDRAILEFLWDHPLHALFGVGLGNVHLYADSYLAPEVAVFAASTAFSAKAGYLKLLSELGVVGLCLFVYWVVSLGRRLASKPGVAESSGPTGMVIYVLTFVAPVSYLAVASVAPQAFLLLGAALSAWMISKSGGTRVRAKP